MGPGGLSTTGITAFGGDDDAFNLWLLSVEARLMAAKYSTAFLKEDFEDEPELPDDIKDPSKDKSLDAAVFSFIISLLKGHPLQLAITNNPHRSGVLALKRLLERYIPSGKDYVANLKYQLRNMEWTSSDTVDTFTSRLSTLATKLSDCGQAVDNEDL